MIKSWLRRGGGRQGGKARAWRDKRGNVAIIVALCLPFLLYGACFAIDFANASYVKQRLNQAADTAVLAATSQSTATAFGGYPSALANGFLYARGLEVFSANSANLSVAVSPSLSVVAYGTNGVAATLTYSTSVASYFGGLLGYSSLPVNGVAKAAVNPLIYINYYIIVDISQSMGIGATATDMQTLYNRVVSYGNGSGGETGCVFGCHVKAPGQTYTNEYLAHSVSPKITLRIDSAIAAIQDIINAASSQAGSNQNIKIGIYTMSKDPVSGNLVNTISAPSYNFSNLLTLAGTIDLGNNTSSGFGDSDFSNQLSTFSSVVSANGTGASASSPLNYVFIITDGLTDTPNTACTSGHCTSAFASSFCSTLKTKATVGVIYTTYLPIYNNNNSAYGFEVKYTQLAAPYVASIPGNLQTCAASTSYYYEASDGPSITTGMQALFASSMQTSHITQ
jgi:Flp pilus assembly protein TadG